jgi:exonuclease III
MKLLSWNIDGLDAETAFIRTIEAIPIFNYYDIVFLQEVTMISKEMIIRMGSITFK